MSRFLRLVAHELELQLRSRRLLLIAVMFVLAALLSGAASAALMRTAEQALLASNPMFADPALQAEALAQLWPEGPDSGLASLSRIEEAVVNIGRYLLPFLLVLAFSDVLSGELRRRTLCYDTMHASRQTLLMAKLCTALLISVSLIGLSLASALLPTALFTQLISLGSVASSTATAFLRLAPLSLACVPMVFFASAVTRQSFSSVFVAGLLVLVLPRLFWVTGYVAGEAGADIVAQGVTATTWVFAPHAGALLAAPEAGALWTGVAVSAGIGLLWTALASVVLRRQQL